MCNYVFHQLSSLNGKVLKFLCTVTVLLFLGS